MKNKFYITTAIDYVNAKPHIGHAFEKCLADAIARYNRLQGKNVFFLTGVDENAQKNVEAAEKANMPIKEFVDKNAKLFIELCKKLNISYDDFIRTTAREHSLVVQKILKKIIDNKDVYKAEYQGLYCVGCESYYTEKDLVDGKCPEHNKKPEIRKEEAYFFKLSKYKAKLLEIIPKYVIPESKKNEILARVKEELNDICITRKGAKWGIDFPQDDKFKVWVWIDALINYISGLKNRQEYWPADLHVIGKGINWFHSVIWPSILLSAGYKLPKKLLVHGYLNLEGKKISKSLGNIIDPLELLKKYPSDIVRFSLLRCNIFEDSDYSEEILIERNNKELANKLGNLVLRVSALAEKHGLEICENKLLEKLKLKQIKDYFENYELDRVLNLIFEFIDICNLYVQENELWKSGDKKKLYQVADSIKAIAILLWPFIPETSEKIAKLLKFEIKSIDQIKKPLEITKIKKAEILFAKIDSMPKEVKLHKINTIINNNKINIRKEKRKINKDKIPGIITMETIKYQDFAKLDLRVGTIKKVEEIPGADKLYKLVVDTGEERILVAGIKQFYKAKELVGKQIVVVCNLEPRTMKGITSQGMLLAAVNQDKSKVILIQPEKTIDAGAKVE